MDQIGIIGTAAWRFSKPLVFLVLLAVLPWTLSTVGEKRLSKIASQISLELPPASTGINVRTAGMTLILEGWVMTEGDKARAELLANAHLSGYHPSQHISAPKILNLIQLRPPPPTDYYKRARMPAAYSQSLTNRRTASTIK